MRHNYFQQLQLAGFLRLSRKLVLLVAAVLLLGHGSLSAQSPMASVTGILNDQSGPVVPNAKVTIKDIARGVAFTTTSNSDGAYNY